MKFAGKLALALLTGLVVWGVLCSDQSYAQIWESRANMNTQRWALHVGVIDNKLYAVGGHDGSAVTDSSEVYDPGSNSWTGTAPMPTPVFGGASGVIGKKLYIVGGWNGNSAPLQTLQIYDPANNSWTIGPNLPVLSGSGTAGVINEKLFIHTPAVGEHPSTRHFHVFDPVQGTWSQKAEVPSIHSGGAAGVIDGKLYVAGGNNSTGITGALDVYDPLTNTWTTKASMKTPRANFASVVYNGKFYAIGGHTVEGLSLGLMEVYDPETDSWAESSPMPTSRTSLGAGLIWGKIHAVGGANPSPAYNVLEVCSGLYPSYYSDPDPMLTYDGDRNTWTSKKDLNGDIVWPSSYVHSGDGRCDIMYGGGSTSYTRFDFTSTGLTSLTSAIITMRGGLDDHGNSSSYQVRVTLNGTIIFQGVPPWNHGDPWGGPFGNITQWSIAIDDLKLLSDINNVSVRLMNPSAPPDWMLIDWISLEVSGAVNRPPVAGIAPAGPAHPGQELTLSSTSTDPDGDFLMHLWSWSNRPVGSSAILQNPTSLNPAFTPDVPGNYQVKLEVSDGKGGTSEASLTISSTNAPPLAEAGGDQPVTKVGEVVTLDGSQSTDPDGDPITLAWSFVKTPDRSNAVLNTIDPKHPSFVPDVYGEYRISLMVSDPWSSSSAEVKISFTNLKPEADPGSYQSVVVGKTVNLDGSNSSDPNGDGLTFRWSLTGFPPGSTVRDFSATTALASFVPDLPGDYVAQLIVNDGFLDSDPKLVQIHVSHNGDYVIGSIQDLINGLPTCEHFKNCNMRNTMINKLNAVIRKVEEGAYQEAIEKLRQDIAAKTDGCAAGSTPDKNDWVIDCEAQTLIYHPLMEIIEQLESLVSP